MIPCKVRSPSSLLNSTPVVQYKSLVAEDLNSKTKHSVDFGQLNIVQRIHVAVKHSFSRVPGLTERKQAIPAGEGLNDFSFLIKN